MSSKVSIGEATERVEAFLTGELADKTFSTGSDGLGGYGKTVIAGERYQCSVSLVRVGSKDDNGAGRVEYPWDEVQRAASFVAHSLTPKTFKSGKVGFYAGGKVTLSGIPHQCSANIVKVGS